MTLSIAWIRTVRTVEELVFATDSRLSGGQNWDACPKIMTLPRGDCLLAFAGSTITAYPLMLQFRNWIELDPRAHSRERDINEIKKRMRLMFMDMRSHISSLPCGVQEPDPYDCELLFGGWSWKEGEFRVWRFSWVPAQQAYDFEPLGEYIKVGKDHPMMFAGTRDAVEEARDRIKQLLMARGKFRTGRYFDMEPFEVLRDVIRERRYHDVGGPPQLAKVYKSGNSQAFAVRWGTSANSNLTILGRALFKGEQTVAPIVDPDRIEFRSPKTVAKCQRLSRAR